MEVIAIGTLASGLVLVRRGTELLEVNPKTGAAFLAPLQSEEEYHHPGVFVASIPQVVERALRFAEDPKRIIRIPNA